jgi:hypothetical protein
MEKCLTSLFSMEHIFRRSFLHHKDKRLSCKSKAF